MSGCSVQLCLSGLQVSSLGGGVGGTLFSRDPTEPQYNPLFSSLLGYDFSPFLTASLGHCL